MQARKTNKYHNRIEPAKEKFLEWPSELEEKVLDTSPEAPCDNQKECRGWDEQKNVAFCKSSLMVQKLLEANPDSMSGKVVFFVKTIMKSQHKGGWSDFLYVEVVDNQAMDKISQGAKFLKVCVPVDADKFAWVDDVCPLDPCGPMPTNRKKCQNTVDSQQM